MKWDEGLTEEQRIAASHIGSPARMLAGPGTGKTLVLSRRILFLIQEQKVNPEEIFALTFTRFAAYELKNRVSDALGTSTLPKISTLHSFALRQILLNSHRIKVLPLPIRVADDWEERNIIFEDIKNTIHAKEIKEVKVLFNELSSDWESKPNGEENFPNPQFIGAWRNHRKLFGYTLRSELVYQLKKSLEQIADFQLERPIKYLLVDEYQDLNPCDLAVIKAIVERGSELFVAGDDDQSIYGFRNAFPDGIKIFPIEYPNSKDLPLKECKRCDKSILKIGEFVARLDPRRIYKGTQPEKDRESGIVEIINFQNETDEAQGISKIINHLRDVEKRLPEILVLLRSDRYGAFTEEISGAFVQNDIPFLYDSEENCPLNKPSGRELLSILRIYKEREDHLAWRTILKVRRNNIGKIILDSIYQTALSHGQSFYETLSFISSDPESFGPYGSRISIEFNQINEMVQALSILVDQLENNNSTIENSIVRIVDTILPDYEDRNIITGKICQSLADSVFISISELIDGILELTSINNPVIDPRKVNILTMHKAKGLSSEIVFIVAAEDEHIPGKYESEPELGDERRLLFVSLTRAKKKLYITYCTNRIGRQRMLGKNPGNTRRNLTQFLRDYPLIPKHGEEYMNNLK